MEFAGYSLLLAIIAPIVFGLIGWVFGRLMRFAYVFAQARYWRSRHVIIAEYKPPGHLRPAEIAYLFDGVFGEAELLATLFDLELRGVVRLERRAHHRTDVDFVIRRSGNKHDVVLADFENEIMSFVGDKGVAWTSLRSDDAVWESNIARVLRTGLEDAGYFYDRRLSGDQKFLFAMTGAAIAGGMTALPVWFARSHSTFTATIGYGHDDLSRDMNTFLVILFFCISAVLYGLATYVGIAMFERAYAVSAATAKLRRLWPTLAGYLRYLDIVERDKITFENETLRHEARVHALPYAIAFNLTTRWQERFK